MHRHNRKAIAELLPPHAFDKTPMGDHIDAAWTSKNGLFGLTTGRNGDTYSVETRVTITNKTSGESVVLVTEDAERVKLALQLIGAL